MPNATFSNFYCVTVLFKEKWKAERGSKEAAKQEVKDASKQLVISSYMFTLQRTLKKTRL